MADAWYEQKLGPLPIGVWIVLVGGGLAIAFYYNSQHEGSGDSASTPMVDTSGIPGVGVGAGTPGWVSVQPPEQPTNNPSTNEQWAIQAINWLIGQGYEPALADKAIRDYIANVALTDREYPLVNLALKHFGSPPVPLGPPHSKPPTKGGTGVPKDYRWQQQPNPGYADERRVSRFVKSTDTGQFSTLEGIAAAMYHDPGRWYYILSANRGIEELRSWPSNPSSAARDLPEGLTIEIPDIAKPGWTWRKGTRNDIPRYFQ